MRMKYPQPIRKGRQRRRRWALPILLMGLLLAGTAQGSAWPETEPAAPFRFETEIALHPGENCQAPQGEGYISSDESVAIVSQGLLQAVKAGECTLTVTQENGERSYTVRVDETVPPAVIQQAIANAQHEFEAWGGHSVPKSNKYTQWYCNKPCEFGWCGGFCGWCLDTAGVPMFRVEKAEPVAGGIPYAVSEAGVGKLLKGYTKMERTTHIPRAGYLVIYGVRNSVNKTVHVGMVTQAEPLGEGRYLITTVEGNVSNRVKSYQYYYDSQAEDATRNMAALPEGLRTDERMSYILHSEDWYINVFCQTYQ